MTTYEPNMVLSEKEFDVVGTRPIRHDGADKVTGRARYSADSFPVGYLHGRVLRSPHAHARIKSIDTSKALAYPGVKSVMTGSDLPEVSAEIADLEEGAAVNYGFYTRNVMAREKALYVGHAVAAVAAVDAHIAEEALGLIEVDYEILTPVLTATEALKDTAPVLHDRLLTQSSALFRVGGWGDDGTAGTSNLALKIISEEGDVEKAFNESDVVVERQFRTKAVHQGYIEPQATTVFWNKDNKVTAWCSTQQLFAFRDHISAILDIPLGNVTVVPLEIGGGFGGKGMGGVYLEPVAAILSKKSGAAVKITMTRAEVFMGTGPTSGTEIEIKVGASNDGSLKAVKARLIFEAGAFPGSPVAGGSRTMLGPYVIPNAYVEGLDVVTNVQKSSAYRAPGSPAAAFAIETVMDEVAEKLNIDPIEFRLLNAAKEGTRQPANGPVYRKIGLVETLEAARNHPHYTSDLNESRKGRGIASGAWFNGSGPASAVASVNADGTVSLVEGSPDIGGSRAAMAMQVADVLGLEAEDVKPSIGDTDSIGYSSGAGGSGVTFKTGTACVEAAYDIKEQMMDRAARIWDVDSSEVEYDKATIRHKSDPELSIEFSELASLLNGTGGPIVGRATVNPGGVGNAFAVHIVDVEVDKETGKVDILRYTSVQDVGKAIHPSYVEGQLQGGAVQGIGWALNEEYIFNSEGNMMNSSFLDYRMPVALDLPMIDTVLVEVANPGHPFGLRGVGEACLIPPMAAIANAIYDAVGVRMTELPMTPGRVVDSLNR
ncbi:MAG TPA: oxidoreductase [Dehalococcoidia bacterium]|nr:oxidoreductase [Chloroflexota bacterium]HCE76007.1 oxidoreductase [Dehalococcoidia bacterium]|tara:strand:- start:9574 stop:11889 length:2316 start_codon:yes stop_codon:yes gene_type:complete